MGWEASYRGRRRWGPRSLPVNALGKPRRLRFEPLERRRLLAAANPGLLISEVEAQQLRAVAANPLVSNLAPTPVAVAAPPTTALVATPTTIGNATELLGSAGLQGGGPTLTSPSLSDATRAATLTAFSTTDLLGTGLLFGTHIGPDTGGGGRPMVILGPLPKKGSEPGQTQGSGQGQGQNTPPATSTPSDHVPEDKGQTSPSNAPRNDHQRKTGGHTGRSDTSMYDAVLSGLFAGSRNSGDPWVETASPNVPVASRNPPQVASEQRAVEQTSPQHRTAVVAGQHSRETTRK